MYNKENVKKVCSFCVSDLHLITMLLPYLNKRIKENEKFITISERDLTESVKLVLSRLTLKGEDKKDIINVNWKAIEIVNSEQIKSQLIKKFKKSDKMNIIINGSKEYIETVNRILNEILVNRENAQIKIINCYDITKLDDDIKDILKTHDIILNTSGEKEISEVFEGYEKRKYA